MNGGLSPSAAERLMAGIVEMMLTAEEQDLMPVEASLECRHRRLVQVTAQPDAPDLGTDATGNRLPFEVQAWLGNG
jgi:hypothetical protein